MLLIIQLTNTTLYGDTVKIDDGTGELYECTYSLYVGTIYCILYTTFAQKYFINLVSPYITQRTLWKRKEA